MDAKKLAAIALTLIVCVPIAAGYALNIETEEESALETTNSSNISDLLLNSRGTYSMTSYDAGNNEYLLEYKNSQWEPGLLQWNQTSTNASSIPVVQSIETGTVAMNYNETVQITDEVAWQIDGAKINITDNNWAIIQINCTSGTELTIMGTDGSAYNHTVDSSDFPRPQTTWMPVYLTPTGNGDADIIAPFNDSQSPSWKIIQSLGTKHISSFYAHNINETITIHYRPYTEMTQTTQVSYGGKSTNLTGVWDSKTISPILRITHGDGSYEVVYPTRTGVTEHGTEAYLYNGNILISANLWSMTISGGGYGKEITDVSKIEIATYPPNDTLSSELHPLLNIYHNVLASGEYAQIAYGWKVDPTARYSAWYNHQSNEGLRLLIDRSNVSSGSPLVIYTDDSLSFDPDNQIRIRYHVSVGSGRLGAYTDLGSYDKLEVVMTRTGWTVYGLEEWPSIGTVPTRYNSISGTWASEHNLQYVIIQDDYQTTFRMDEATITAGSYMTTKDKTYDPLDKFPGDGYALEVTSVGVYGDSLTWHGRTWNVTNGRITLDSGKVTPIRGLTLSAAKLQDSDDWVYRINGDVISQGAKQSGWDSLTLSGEWSLTMHQYTTSWTTQPSTHWVPGHFAFDKTDYVICALGVSVAAFVVCGMSGARNGAKIGLLALVCGGMACGLIIIA